MSSTFPKNFPIKPCSFPQKSVEWWTDIRGKAVRGMRQYEVLKDKELFPGSDIVRSFGYKTAVSGDNYALLGKSDCFVRRSPYDGMIGNMTVL